MTAWKASVSRSMCVASAAAVCCLAAAAQVQPVGVPHVYKTVNGRELHAYVSSPQDNAAQHPAIVFFHGGGWTGGSVTQFNMQSQELAARGMVAVDVEYRLVAKTPSTESPEICVQDAKSAMRWVRSHAKELHIDPSRIAAGGGSAGGYLAAAVALVPGWDDPHDDLTISPKPGALALFFPVVNTGPHGYGIARFGQEWQKYSPEEFLSAQAPPTIIEGGGADKLVHPDTLAEYKAKCDAVGARCQLDMFPGQEHGFANNEPYRTLTLNNVIHFFKTIGYLPANTQDIAAHDGASAQTLPY